jgi:calcineurin-like phosphoesterase family protein
VIYFTADTHFNHYNIIKYCNRPFKSIEEMDNVIINNINEQLQNDDTLYILGDFCFGDDKKISIYRNRIYISDIRLVLGNHDKILRKNYRLRNLFTEVCEFGQEIKIDNKRITISHYAMDTWPGSNHGAISLHGHSHAQLPIKNNRLDVGVDNNHMKIFSLLEIYERIGKQNEYIF